jgi:hypothetical protein
VEQKFILTQKGYLRCGIVHMHRDLLKDGDECIGGGYYQLDYVSNILVLDRESFDYGEPRWNLLVQSDIPLRVPSAFKGLQIIYYSQDNCQPDFRVSQELQVLYED